MDWGYLPKGTALGNMQKQLIPIQAQFMCISINMSLPSHSGLYFMCIVEVQRIFKYWYIWMLANIQICFHLLEYLFTTILLNTAYTYFAIIIGKLIFTVENGR